MKIAGAGSPESVANVKSLCDKKIEYLGPINGNYKANVLAKARAMFLLTQPAIAEAGPVSVPEALVSGTPIISSIHASMPEVVKDGETGFNCAKEKDVIKAVLDIGKIDVHACREYAIEHFTCKDASEKYMSYYGMVMDSFAQEGKSRIYGP